MKNLEEIYNKNTEVLEKLSKLTFEGLANNEEEMYNFASETIYWAYDLWIFIKKHPEAKSDKKLQEYIAESGAYLDKLTKYYFRFIARLDEEINNREGYYSKDHCFNNYTARSAIEALLELYAGTAFDIHRSIFDVSEVDDNLEIWNQGEAHVLAEEIPDYIPDSHWWWWCGRERPVD